VWFLSMLTDVAKEIWRTFADASVYILFGVFVAGVIQIFVDKDKIARHLGKPGMRSVVVAALFGVPLPLCSCGVIPMAVSLRKNGASKGAVLSFLISTPESGVDSIAISFALLDPLIAFFRPVAAFITAFIAGLMENLFGVKDTGAVHHDQGCIFCKEEGGAHDHGFLFKFKHGMHYAFVDLLGDIAVWLGIGIAVGGIISYFVPQDFIGRYFGTDWQAMLVMLVIGIPLYICASASTPIAAALIAKGMSPGVALVFLLAGPATNMAGILSVGKFLGKRSAVIYLFSIAACALLLGIALNQIYAGLGIDSKAVLGKAGDIIPGHIKTVASILLIVLMARSLARAKKCA
jgi:uncharacterized protein